LSQASFKPIEHLGRTPTPPTPSGWAIWFRNRAIAIPDELIVHIRATPTTSMGSFEEELCATWKNLFPLTQASGMNEKLALD